MAEVAVIRDATAADVAAIAVVYNALISSTTVAWTEATESVDDRAAWFDKQTAAGRPVLVATVDDDVVGFASYGDFRDSTKWPGYRFTVEHTVHVAELCWNAGVGRALMTELMQRAGDAGLHVMIGAIDSENDGSVRFHRRLGFEVVGRLPQIGFKFDRWLDLVLMQRTL
jgi:L-amino acid N-acyltransferase YncA